MFYPCGTCLGRTCKVLMYFVIPIAYLRRVFECMYWVPLSVFWSTDDRSMVFLWLFSRFPPQAHLVTKGAVTHYISDLTVCSFKYASVLLLACACAKFLYVCRSCHLFLVLCTSPVSGRAFDVVNRRFLQCEIAPDLLNERASLNHCYYTLFLNVTPSFCLLLSLSYSPAFKLSVLFLAFFYIMLWMCLCTESYFLWNI